MLGDFSRKKKKALKKERKRINTQCCWEVKQNKKEEEERKKQVNVPINSEVVDNSESVPGVVDKKSGETRRDRKCSDEVY